MAEKVIKQTIILVTKAGLGGKGCGLKSATALIRDVVRNLRKARYSSKSLVHSI